MVASKREPVIDSIWPIADSSTAKMSARWAALPRSSVAVEATPFVASAALKADYAWAAVNSL